MNYLTIAFLIFSQAVAADAPAADKDNAVISLVDDNMSDNERLSSAKQLVSNMNSALTSVIGHLQSAREEKDAIKLNCVSEKLTKIKGLLKISEQANVSLQEAIARKDTNTAAAEYSKISIAGQTCNQMAADSEACIGELAVYAGEGETTVENNNESPYSTADLSADAQSVVVVMRPPEASPYQ